MRLWRDNSKAMLDKDTAVDSEISGLLEWFICECISYGPKELGGWWSDGIIQLEITTYNDQSFRLLGVTWIDCHGVAPFEIDLQMNQHDDEYFAKTIFRIGMRDEQGLPKLSGETRNINRLIEHRPLCNNAWAMAIELTPPEDRARTKR